LPWNAGKTGIMVAVMVTSVTCDGDECHAAASCAECTAMCAECTAMCAECTAMCAEMAN
jgi:hypothetical protein